MIGEIINEKYKIEAAFSESHMYEIFSALELATGSRVVIKILKEEMAVNSDRIRGFSEEIKSFASLSHPLIAEVLDVDMFDDRPYVVSPVVGGKELHQLVKEDKLPLNDCVRIVQDLASVLQYAADQKVEHRTIKLSNILRREDGRITVLSFTHPRLKLAGRTTRSEGAGVHSDLFFLGSTLFELLAGESPIRKRGGINELWDMKLEKLLRIRHPEMPPEQLARIVEFVRRTLTRDLSERFNSHEEFLKSLADLSGNIRETNIRSRSRQLSMASQVVDALNGKMSDAVAASAVASTPGRFAVSAQAIAGSADSGNGAPAALASANTFASPAVEGNLALVVDNGDREDTGSEAPEKNTAARPRKHLRLVKPSLERPANDDAWKTSEERHWFKNPVLFMGISLVVMVFLVLSW